MASGEYSSCSTASGMGNSWNDLSKSDYAKVIFSDLYYNPHSSVGCRFQITDNVHEDPCDYVGLFKVGYDNLSECLVSKLLSQTECEEDGKLLRCTFKISELPTLEGGYYQFLYVTRDNEVCGASLPFAIGHTVHMAKDCSSDEDVVADRTEDDFLVVRSNLAEKNRQLETLLDKMTRTYMTLEDKLMKNFKEEVEKKQKLEEELKFIHSEMDKFSEKCKLIAVEHCIMYTSNEAVVEYLQRKVALLESQLADADHRIKELEVMKTALEDEKNRAICEKIRLQETVDELKSTSELKNAETAEIKYMMERKNEDKIAEVYEDRNMLSSQLENAQIMIKALEESKQLVMNEMSQMSTQIADYKRKNLDLLSQLTALKMHFLEVQNKMSEDEAAPAEKLKTAADKDCVNFKCEKLLPLQKEMQAVLTEAKEMKEFSDIPHEDIQKLSDLKHRNDKLQRELGHFSEAAKKYNQKLREEMEHLKTENEKLHCELDERNSIISELKNEALKKDAVIEFLCTEKNNIQKTATAFESNYNDCIMRLKQASEIYKKQYLEIQKLRKKLEKAKSHPKADEKKSAGTKALGSLLEQHWCLLNKSEGKKDTEGQRRKYSRSKTTGSISECSSVQNQSSDSDTGEHVLRHHVEKKNANDCPCPINELGYPEDFLKKLDADLQRELDSSITAYSKKIPEISDRKFKDVFGQTLDVTYLAVASESSEPSAPKSRESPELQSMIEQNLAKLSNSCSNQPSASKSEISLDQQTVSEQTLGKPSSSSLITAEQVMYTLPCPVCDGDIGVEGSSTEEMVKHLEVQHKQQMCPVCGRLFDMTLPEKYFMYHVEDHFMKKK